MDEAPQAVEKVDAPPVAPPVAPAAASANVKQFSVDELSAVLTAKQKRSLGIEAARPKTEKELNRLNALRERMREINNKRREEKEKQKQPPVKPKRPAPPPESSESSSDEYIQRKAKKVNKTLQQLSKMDQYIAHLKQQNSHNPFFNLMMR